MEPVFSTEGTRVSRSIERPVRQLKSAPPAPVPTDDFSTIYLDSIFRQGEQEKENQLSRNFSANCWSQIHLLGLSQVDGNCLCLYLYPSLHVKFSTTAAAAAPKSRPVRRIKDCFASFLQTAATPPLLHSYWCSAYINITFWHASTAKLQVIG